MTDSGEISPDASSPECFAIDLLDRFERSGIAYAVVGDARPLGKTIDGDVDVIVENEALDRVPQVIDQFAHERGARLVQVLQHEAGAFYFVLTWLEKGSPRQFLAIDVCGDYVRNGRLILPSRFLLERRQMVRPSETRAARFYAPRPAANFLYYLAKKIDKGELTTSHGRLLSEIWRSDPAGCEASLSRFWGSRHCKIMASAAATNQWSLVKAEITKLRKHLRGSLKRPLACRYREIRRKIDRVRYPTGLTVVLLGPDGSGKSSVGERIATTLSPAFRATRRYHLRPDPFRRRQARIAETNPHSAPVRGGIASFAKLAYWALEYTVGFATQIWPRLIRSNLIVFDRYYDDLCADPERYRYGGGSRLVQAWRCLVPRCDLLIVLDAPPEKLLARKQEITFEAAERLLGAYRALASSTIGARIVNADPPLDSVVLSVEQVVIDHLARRTASRLGLLGGAVDFGSLGATSRAAGGA